MSDVGFLPCGGRATRLKPPVPKELMAIGWEQGRPISMLEYSVRAMREAGVEKVLVLAAPGKEQLLARVMDRMEISYAMVVQEEPLGTGHALAISVPWLVEERIFYAMPDTIMRPNPFPVLAQAMDVASNIDCALALYDTDAPQHFGTFALDIEGPADYSWIAGGEPEPRWPFRVRAHAEKASFGQGGFPMHWGAAILNGAMAFQAMEMWANGTWRKWAQRRQEFSGRGGNEFTIDDVFDGALEEGLDLRGVMGAHWRYVDAGTEQGFREAQALLAQKEMAI